MGEFSVRNNLDRIRPCMACGEDREAARRNHTLAFATWQASTPVGGRAPPVSGKLSISESKGVVMVVGFPSSRMAW